MTSVGMLRRAAGILQCLARQATCRAPIGRHQQRLLQFTMSQLMDSRVAAVVADTLYELHKDKQQDNDDDLLTASTTSEKDAKELIDDVDIDMPDVDMKQSPLLNNNNNINNT